MGAVRLFFLSLAVSLMACVRVPDLYLHSGPIIEVGLEIIDLDLRTYWNYDWEKDWTYGWDEEDRQMFGEIGYTLPKTFQLRAFDLVKDSAGYRRFGEDISYFSKYSFKREFKKESIFNFVVWNERNEEEQSSIINDEDSYAGIGIYTNLNINSRSKSYQQPEEYFSAEAPQFYMSKYANEYDYFDENERQFYAYGELILHPITYIYLVQIRFHNNQDKKGKPILVNAFSEAIFRGMARGSTIDNGEANESSVGVSFSMRMKQNLKLGNEYVDVVGGRCLTFGMLGQRSSHLSSKNFTSDQTKKYIDVQLFFNNTYDSTYLWDVTDQVKEHYRGGVITIDVDMDTLPIPQDSITGGIDARVIDFEDTSYYFDIENY